MRAAALAAAVIAGFLGVMYVRFSGDTVPAPEATRTPAAAQVSLGDRCERFSRYPKPRQCGTPTGPLWWAVPTVPPTPEPAIPDVLQDMTIIPLNLGSPMDLPKDLAFIVETGCWQCDGGPGQLVRVYSRADGSAAPDLLLDPSKLGLPPRQYTDINGVVTENPPSITGWALAPDASDIVASVCIRGTCAGEGLNSWSADSQTVLFRSSDGGVGWTELARLEVGASVFAILPDGRLILTTYDSRESTTVRTYPGLEPFPLRPGSEYGPVEVLADGQVLSRDSSGVPTRSDGSPLLTISRGSSTRVDDVLIEPAQQDGLASLIAPGTSVEHIAPFDASGALGRGPFAWAGDSVVWRTPDHVRLGVILSDGKIAGNAYVPSLETPPAGVGPTFNYRPVIIDLKEGTMRELAPLTASEHRYGRTHIVAVQQGPFARVIDTEGACLNVRAEPGASEVFDCARKESSSVT